MLLLGVPAGARIHWVPVPRPQAPTTKTENLRHGSGGWAPSDALNHGIEGWASTLSVEPGESVPLHISTDPAAPYRIQVFRIGWYGSAGGRLVACLPSDCVSYEQGNPQPVPAPDTNGTVRTNWPVTDTIRTGLDWTSGYYLAKLTLQDGRQPNGILFVVRERPRDDSRVLVVAPTNTWQAYNFWGGKSLYDFSSDGHVPANRVSFDRPWSPGSQSQFFAWSVQLVRFLERNGYDVSYATDQDIDRNPQELLRHTLIVVNGHGEYWTSRERDAFDDARDAGVNLAFIGANIGYWQVRYEDDRRTIVGYKSAADPNPDPQAKTTLFRALPTPRLECALEGVMHQGSIERPGTPPADYSVNPNALSDPWFYGTGFTATSTITGVVAPEWDQVVDPKKGAESCWFPNMTVFFHHEGPPGNADAVRYIAKSGAMVFSSGSLGFVWALDPFSRNGFAPEDARVEQFMKNAFNDLTQGSSWAWLPGASWNP